MNKVSFREINQSKLSSTPIIEGCITVCSDSGRIYKDTSTEHKLLSEQILFVDELPIAPLLNKFYFYNNALYLYVNDDWVNLNGASEEQIRNSVNEYLNKNPVAPGATSEQAEQIQDNTNKITQLRGDLADKVPKKDYAPETKTESMTQPVGKDENGKLWTAPGSGGNVDQEQLTSAVNEALAEAKASGEFDGAPGEKGDKGDKGDPGEPGKDGASATHSWNGTVLTVTSASGTSSADLKGDKGDTGPAYTLTETDQEAIVQQVTIAMGMPVVGTVDVNNNIILTGQLREGTYSIMYEYADGTLINVGTIRIANDDSGEQIEGYQRVEYIESSGTQYILTGITGHTGLTIEADAQLAVSPTESGDACLFGSHDGTNRCLVNYNTSGKRWELGAGNYKFGAEGSVIDVDRHKFTAIIQTGTSTFSIDGSTEITIDDTSSFDNGVEMAIFARYRGTTVERIGAYRIYSFKIIDTGVTVRNFVPVVRDLDSVVGMYDTVNGVFYTNAGTGNLTAGPNV